MKNGSDGRYFLYASKSNCQTDPYMFHQQSDHNVRSWPQVNAAPGSFFNSKFTSIVSSGRGKGLSFGLLPREHNVIISIWTQRSSLYAWNSLIPDSRWMYYIPWPMCFQDGRNIPSCDCCSKERACRGKRSGVNARDSLRVCWQTWMQNPWLKDYGCTSERRRVKLMILCSSMEALALQASGMEWTEAPNRYHHHTAMVVITMWWSCIELGLVWKLYSKPQMSMLPLFPAIKQCLNGCNSLFAENVSQLERRVLVWLRAWRNSGRTRQYGARFSSKSCALSSPWQCRVQLRKRSRWSIFPAHTSRWPDYGATLHVVLHVIDSQWEPAWWQKRQSENEGVKPWCWPRIRQTRTSPRAV